MKIKITKDMVLDFANLTGDFNPIHLDENYAKNTIFKNPIIHGTFVSGFIGNKIAKEFNSPILKTLDLKFIKPIYVGSIVEINFKKIESDKNHIFLNIEVISSGKLCVIGKSEIVLKNV